MQAIENAKFKVEEASYFLRLMRRVEKTRVPLLEGIEATQEFSHLYSAFLNSCYSAIRQLKGNTKVKQAATTFMKANYEYYGPGENGGVRTQSVYFKPYKARHSGYVAPPGDKVILLFDSEPIDEQNGAALNLDLESYFYDSPKNPQNPITAKCAVHLSKIHSLIQECQTFAQQGFNQTPASTT